MTINIVRADPAGNITAIVTSAVDPSQYASVSSYILQHRIEGIQQVGFLASPKFGGELRLEMMGGEFCGNALRSVGAYWAKKQNIRKACEIEVEISGAKWPLIVNVDPNESSAFAQMPIPQILEKTVFFDQIYVPVFVDGIVHLICTEHPNDVDSIDQTMIEACRRYKKEACGIMFVDQQTRFMTPVVYVAPTASIVYEGSCASGTTALAAVLAHNYSEGIHTYPV